MCWLSINVLFLFMLVSYLKNTPKHFFKEKFRFNEFKKVMWCNLKVKRSIYLAPRNHLN